MIPHINRQVMLRGATICLLLTGGGVELMGQDADASSPAPASATAGDSTPAPEWASMPADSYQSMPSSWLPLTTAPFRDTEYGDIPHYGAPDEPSRGYPHYDYPNERYGQWYRPRAFGLKQDERCLPRPFRPRGYGNLLHRASTCYRVDYSPFVLDDPVTRFGPSYFVRQPDPRCGGDELITINEDVRWYRFNLRQQCCRVADSLRSMLHPRWYCD